MELGAGRRPMRALAAVLLALACCTSSCAARGLLDAPAPAFSDANLPIAEPAGAALAAASSADDTYPPAVDPAPPPPSPAPPRPPRPRRHVERIVRPTEHPRRDWVPLSDLGGTAFELAANGSEETPVHTAASQSYCYCRVSPSGNCRKSVYTTYSRVQIKNDCAVGVYVAVNVQRYLPSCWWGPKYAPTGTCKGFLEYTPPPTVPPPASKCPTMYAATEGWWEIKSGITSFLVGGPTTNKDYLYTQNNGIYFYAESTTKVNGKTLTWAGSFNKGPGNFVTRTLPMRWFALSSGTDSVIRLTCQ